MSKSVEEIFQVAINNRKFYHDVINYLNYRVLEEGAQRKHISRCRCSLDYDSGLAGLDIHKFQDLILNHYREEAMGYGNPWPWECATKVTKVTKTTPSLKQENTIMLKVEKKVFVNGSDIKGQSDDSLFLIIQSTEKEIATLSEIKSKPKKLVVRIKEMEEGLKALIEVMDAAV